jgi:serine/threonine protein kinase
MWARLVDLHDVGNSISFEESSPCVCIVELGATFRLDEKTRRVFMTHAEKVPISVNGIKVPGKRVIRLFENDLLTSLEKSFVFCLTSDLDSLLYFSKQWKKQCALGFHYQPIEQIGKGSFSTVFTAQNKRIGIDSSVCCCKIIQKHHVEEEQHRECRVLYKLRDHPNIIKIKDYFFDEKSNILVTEYDPKMTSLFDDIHERIELKTVTEHYRKRIMFQLLDTLRYIHSKGIAHLDVKPENVLVNPDTLDLKLIDFGFATEFDAEKRLRKINGSLFYMAPEIFSKTGYDEKVDVFSAGVILFTMIVGHLPFHENDTVRDKFTVNIDEIESKDLLCGMLDPNPSSRWSASRCLSHAWFL